MSNNLDKFEEMQKIIKQAFPDDQTISRHLGEMMDFLKDDTVAWNPDEASRELGIAFLDEAERDVSSCRRLYSKKIYPHAVYHFQQATEKAMKGYCLGLGISTIEEIKIRGHDTPYVLLRATFEKTGMKRLLQSFGGDSQDRLDKAWEAIYKPEKRLEIARITFQEIKGHLGDIDKNEPTINELANKLSQLLIRIKGTEEPPPLFLQTLSILRRIYVLGVISFPHEEFTRYPDGEITPPEYASDLGIVKGIPHMIRCLIPVIKELRFRLAQNIAET